MDMSWPLYGDILPRLQGTKIRGCQFCLPSALTLPCSHSMWSVLSGFSLRSETKVPGPEAFTAVTTLQMSALPCSLSLFPSKKTPYVFKFAPFPISLFRTQYKPPQESEVVCVYMSVWKCMCVCKKKNFFPGEYPPFPPKKGEEEMKIRKERPSPLLDTAEPLDTIRCW